MEDGFTGAMLDSAQAQGGIADILARLAEPAPLLEHVGLYAVQSTRERITQTKDAPGGDAWAAWMPATRYARTRKGNAEQGLLWDSGALLDSIGATVDGHAVTIGTDAAYAGYLQYGTEKMTARPFIGFSEADADLYELLTARYLAEGL